MTILPENSPARPTDPKKDPAQAPLTIGVNAAGIPGELKAMRQWVRWRWKWDPKRSCWTKVPVQGARNQLASTMDPATWTSFEDALANVPADGCQGIGFVFSQEDPYCGIDIDGCRDAASGGLTDQATEIMKRLAGYTEASATGTGIHIIVKAALPGGAGRKRGQLEIYDRGRYFAFTGAVVGGDRAD